MPLLIILSGALLLFFVLINLDYWEERLRMTAAERRSDDERDLLEGQLW